MTTTPIGKVESLLVPRAASTTPVTKDSPLPGMISKRGDPEAEIRAKQRVRYQSFDMRDLGDLAELERIETMAWRNQGVYILERKNYTFMDKMYFLVQYIEESE